MRFLLPLSFALLIGFASGDLIGMRQGSSTTSQACWRGAHEMEYDRTFRLFDLFKNQQQEELGGELRTSLAHWYAAHKCYPEIPCDEFCHVGITRTERLAQQDDLLHEEIGEACNRSALH